MSRPRPCSLLLFFTLPFFLGVGLASCGADNLGSVWNGGGEEGDGNDDGGSNTTHDPAPPVSWFDHAVIEPGPPQVVAMEPGGGYKLDVDTQSPVLIWFNESLNPASVTQNSFGVRVKETRTKISASVESLSNGRCVSIVPTINLVLVQDYEIFATFQVHDLDGLLLTSFDDVVLGSFRTTSDLAGLPPRVVAAYPPNGISHPPDTLPVIAFSNPMRPDDVVAYLKIHPAEADGDPVDPDPGDVQFQEAFNVSGNQIWMFNLPEVGEVNGGSGDFALDGFFGFRLTNAIDNYFGDPLASLPFDSYWRTHSFLRPERIDTFDTFETDFGALSPSSIEADVNATNIGSFVVGFGLGKARDASSLDVTVQISESVASSVSDGVASVSQSASGLIYSEASPSRGSIEFDLGSSADPLLADGSLVIGAFATYNGKRSSVRLLAREGGWVFDTPVQDTVPPVLGAQGMGPPFITYGEKIFRTDLSEFRPFGMANEQISKVALTAFGDIDADGLPDPLSSALVRSGFPYASGWFLGPYLPDTGFLGGSDAVPFAIQLTDAVGNIGQEISDLELELVGYSASDVGSSSLLVSAFDADTMAPVSVRLQVGDGSLSNSEREHLIVNWDSGQVLTLVNPAYRTTTLYHISSGKVSVPLRRLVPVATSFSPSFDLNGLATQAEILLGHSGFLNEDGSDLRPVAVWTGGSPSSGFGGFGGGNPELIATSRPAWSVAFADVANSEFQVGDDFTIDPRRILEPSLTSVSSSDSPDWTFGDGAGGVQDVTSFRGSEDIFSAWSGPGTESFSGVASTHSIEWFPVAFLPGILGQSLLGFYSDSGVDSVFVKSEALTIAAYERGDDVSQVIDPTNDFVRVVDSRDDGWVSVDLVEGWDSQLALPFAAVGASSFIPVGDTYALAFQPTDEDGFDLSPTGVYRFQLGEYDTVNSLANWSWDIWVLDGAQVQDNLSGDSEITLPDLRDSAAQLFGPLSTVPGTSWLIASEAWGVGGWNPSAGFFFSDIPRLADSWGRKIAPNVFNP